MTNADMTLQESSSKAKAGLNDYIRIARFDHMTKHVFILPGIALAFILRGEAAGSLGHIAFNVIIGLVAAIFVASANYVINEWLDRDFDRFHPEKSQRAAVQREMSPQIVVIEYALFLAAGLILASYVNGTFFWAAVMLALSGLIYNVPPIRSKDRMYIDVLSESLNNPIRLLMGWAMVDAGSLPPISLFLAFWFGGAFLMNSKRLSEYRDIVASDGIEILGRYRRSFRYYSETRLSVANLVYALCCAFFLAVFLVKYRIEYVLLFPSIVALFALYYSLALRPNSVARKPERLYRAKKLVAVATFTALLFAVTTVVDMPWLYDLTEQNFIELRR